MTTHSYPALTEIVLPWGFSLYNRITDFDLRYRGYYMAARRYEISLLVLKNISRVSAANEWNIFFNTRREISYLQATINTVTLKIKVHLSPLVTIILFHITLRFFLFFAIWLMPFFLWPVEFARNLVYGRAKWTYGERSYVLIPFERGRGGGEVLGD